MEPVSQWSAVLALEGVPTSDGRLFTVGALDWRTPPLTLYAQFENAEGHDEAPIAGRIDSVTRIQQASEARLVAAGGFDSGAAGLQAMRLVGDQTLRGISVDCAIHEAEFIDLDTGAPVTDETPLDATVEMRVTSATILAATLVGMPAFEEATVAITADAGRATLLVPLQMTITRTVTAPAAAEERYEPSVVASIMHAASQSIIENRERDREAHRESLLAIQAGMREDRAHNDALTAALTAAAEKPTYITLPSINVEAAPAPNVTVEPTHVYVEPPDVHVAVSNPPQRPTRILRDGANRIIGTEPVEAEAI